MKKPTQIAVAAGQKSRGTAQAAGRTRQFKGTRSAQPTLPPLVLPENFDTQHHLKVAAIGKIQPLTPADFSRRIAALRAKKVG